MIAGVLFRLALCALFFFVAHYALERDRLSEILRDASRQFKGTENAYDGLMTYQRPATQVFYGFSALFFLFASLFLYHHLRALRVVEDPATQARPYGTVQPNSAAPTNRPPAAQPYGQPSGAGQPSGSGQPSGTVQPQGGAQPYGGQPSGSAQPSGAGQPSGTVQPQGGAQPYGGR